MFKTYVTVALRRLGKEKGYATISIFGLAIGMACCVLIFLFVRNEWAVNSQFSSVDQIHRVESEWREETMGIPITTLAPVGTTLVQEYPEVTDQVRLYLMSSAIRVEEESHRESIMMADTSFLRIFDLPLIAGDAATAMQSPRSMLISEDLAESLFGTHDVLGEVVMMETWNNGWQPFTVTGVWKTLAYNSVTRFGEGNFQVLISPYPFNDFIGEPGWNSWESRYIMQYVKLADEVDPPALNEKLDGFIDSYAPEAFHGNLAIQLNPLRTLYLSENDNQGWRMLQLLFGMGVLVLLIACINFTNLAVGQSMRRIKEIGVQKGYWGASESTAEAVLYRVLCEKHASCSVGEYHSYRLSRSILCIISERNCVGYPVGMGDVGLFSRPRVDYWCRFGGISRLLVVILSADQSHKGPSRCARFIAYVASWAGGRAVYRCYHFNRFGVDDHEANLVYTRQRPGLR